MFKRFIKKIYFKFFNKLIFLIGSIGIRKLRKTYKDIKFIEDAELKVFSQGGDDGIIDFLIHSLNIHKPFFLEIGVEDYTESNTKFLFDRTSCKGMIIDLKKNLEENVKKFTNISKGNLKIIEKEINSENINDIIVQNSADKNLDLFSLDIDGVDYWVLEKLNENFTKIAIIEYNALFGPKLEVTVPNINEFNRTKYHYSNLCFGASLRAIINLMEKKNFVFLGANLLRNNAYFLQKNYLESININLPDKEDLSNYTNSNIRESRDKNSKKTYLSGSLRLKEIKDCEVYDIKTNKIKILSELI